MQKKVTVREMELWQAYFKKHGQPSLERMFDRGPAIIASMLSAAHGGKAKVEDFMPYPRGPKMENQESPPSLEALAATFGTKVVYNG